MWRLLLTLLLALTCCSSRGDRQQKALMDMVERRVQMPSGSEAIGKYARYYALGDQGRVIGIYIMTVEPENRMYDLPLGKRRWLNDAHELPRIMDGGCSVVTVEFDPKTNKADAGCNGVA